MRLAARGARELGGGVEPIADPAEARLLRLQAARVHVSAVVIATLLAGLAALVAARVGG